ncbi:MAG: M20/M25/M40 family metallo-hydrolase [Candidatus Cloacimonadaceae bacterium]|jgi:leucyl aminopeptidase|nr:M20/M25/M40 family metallo-hydrolase [Candidatus Cloacimonadaceae bacterium]
MKKSLLILILLCALALLGAETKYLAIIPFSAASNNRHKIQNLAQESAIIYYYNDQYAIVAFDKEQETNYEHIVYPNARENLYLIQSCDTVTIGSLESLGRTHILPGGDILFISSIGAVQLRSYTMDSFINLREHPLEIPKMRFSPNSMHETRQDLVQLSSMVSADSIQFFIQALQDMQTRYALADNRYAVASWIRDTFQRFGIQNAHLEEFTWNETQQYNVVATIEGSVYPDQYVVVGGHHDSITYADPMNFAPGADDNASGAVAAIETARVLMTAGYQPKCSIRFVTYAAEEFGLHGSHYNAQSSLESGDDIRLMINHDMIANDPNNLDLVRLMPYDGCLEQSEYASLLVAEYSSLTATYGSLNSHSSDSYSYWSRGYPVIYFFEQEFSPVYHSDQDIIDFIDPVYCAEVIKASIASSVSFANMPASVTDLAIHDNGDGSSLLISWQIPQDPEIDHVLVFIGTDDPEQSEAIAVYDANSYLATELQEAQTYNIAICTVDALGNQSYREYGSGIPYSVPLAPSSFSSTPIRDAVKLEWSPNSEIDLAGYRLYRATDAGANFAWLTEQLLTDTSFIDTDVFGAPEQFYYYKVRAYDTDGNGGPFSNLSVSRPVTLDHGILIVDETSGGSGANIFVPTNADVDEYYSSVLQNFNTSSVDLEEISRDLRLYDLCIYSSIVWHAADISESLIPEETIAALEEFISLGGKFLYNGYFPSMAFESNNGYPSDFADDDLINRVFGISGVDYLVQARMNIANAEALDLPDLPLADYAGIPAFNNHILRIEGLSAAPGAEILYSYGSDYANDETAGVLNGSAVAIHHQYLLGKSLVLSFPLYLMAAQNVEDMLYELLHVRWAEPVSVDDLHSPTIGSLSIYGVYPNPFKESTLIQVKGLSSALASKLKIYNLRGQLVRSLEMPKAGEFAWDGCDSNGISVGSGIYFARVSQNGNQAQRKLIRIK